MIELALNLQESSDRALASCQASHCAASIRLSNLKSELQEGQDAYDATRHLTKKSPYRSQIKSLKKDVKETRSEVNRLNRELTRIRKSMVRKK